MTDWTQTPWVIVGAGRLGILLGLLAEEVGATVEAAWSRSRRPELAAVYRSAGPVGEVFDHIDGAIVWLTVVDDAIAETARKLAAAQGTPALTLHGSGSLSSKLLTECGVRGPVGSLHPLLSIADPHTARNRATDATWTVEGGAEAIDFAKWFLGELGSAPEVIETDHKILYHAAAVSASGLVTALVDVALGLAGSAGIPRDAARRMLLPLVRSTLDNLEERPAEEALTGPVARRDAETVKRHITALEKLDDPDVVEIYRLLTKRLATASLRREAGLEDD